MNFIFWKILHLFALVFWLGPVIGASWILIQSRRNPDQSHFFIEKYYEQVLRIEHASFALLLLSGFGMAGSLGWEVLREPWLKTKLYLVAGVVLVEILDIWLFHFMIRRQLRSEKNLQKDAWQKILHLRRRGYGILLPAVTALIVGIFYLAVKKSL